MKSFVSNKTKSTMEQLREAVFIILIAINIFPLSSSQPLCITPSLPILKTQGEFCKVSSECASYVCKNNVCTCPESTYFDLCTQSCVNNCNSTVKVETSGHIVRLPQSNTSQQSQYCRWSLEAPAGSLILFRISYLDLKSSDTCSTDFIEVYDGQEPRYRFCQSNETDPKVVASASNKLDITYQESSPGHYGFIGSYYLYTHNSVTSDRFGYIASPRYPQKYPPNYVVSWTIDGGEEVVTFSVQKMEMKDIENDFITVYDGPNTRASNRVRFGRDKAPLDFTTTSNFLHIVFQSDGSFEFPGFYASFKVQGRGEGKTCNVTHVCLENMTCVNGHCKCGQGQFYNTSSSMYIPGQDVLFIYTACHKNLRKRISFKQDRAIGRLEHSEYIKPLTEAKEINLTLIVGITIGVLVAVCLVSVVIIGVRRHRKSHDKSINGTWRSHGSGMNSSCTNEKRSRNPGNVYNPMESTSPARENNRGRPKARIPSEIVDEHIYEDQEKIYLNNMVLQTQDNPFDGNAYDEFYENTDVYNDVSTDLVGDDKIYENNCFIGHRDTNVKTDEDTIYDIVFCPRN